MTTGLKIKHKVVVTGNLQEIFKYEKMKRLSRLWSLEIAAGRDDISKEVIEACENSGIAKIQTLGIKIYKSVKKSQQLKVHFFYNIAKERSLLNCNN